MLKDLGMCSYPLMGHLDNANCSYFCISCVHVMYFYCLYCPVAYTCTNTKTNVINSYSVVIYLRFFQHDLLVVEPFYKFVNWIEPDKCKYDDVFLSRCKWQMKDIEGLSMQATFNFERVSLNGPKIFYDVIAFNQEWFK